MRNLAGWLPPSLRIPALAALHRDVKILALSMLLWEIRLTLYDPILPIHLRRVGANPGQVGLAAGLIVLAIGLIAGNTAFPLLVLAFLLQGGMIVSRSLIDAEVRRLGRP